MAFCAGFWWRRLNERRGIHFRPVHQSLDGQPLGKNQLISRQTGDSWANLERLFEEDCLTEGKCHAAVRFHFRTWTRCREMSSAVARIAPKRIDDTRIKFDLNAARQSEDFHHRCHEVETIVEITINQNSLQCGDCVIHTLD